MFTVTEAAQKEISKFFETRTASPIRIFLNSGGCGGPQLAMALDERKDEDTHYLVAGMEYVVDTEFLHNAHPLVVDFKETGFVIDSSLKLQSACSSCGTHGSCCS